MMQHNTTKQTGYQTHGHGLQNLYSGVRFPPRLQTVVALGTRYGYGNLIAHLQTAWARHLVKDLDFSEESARLAATGGNGYPFEWQERILANAPTPTFAERIKTLEDLLAFDKNAWQFHEPSYATLCLSEQQISFGKFCEYMRHLCDGQKDAIIQGVTPGAGGAA